ncbi:unnamed protein product, partial [Prorocentrum cordatum]
RRPVHACRRADEQAAGGCVSRRGSHRADAERPGRGAASRHAERPDAADADERRAAEWWRHAEQRHVRQRHAAPQHHAHRPAAAWRGARARHGWRPGRPGPLPGGRRPAGPLVAAHARALAGGPREEGARGPAAGGAGLGVAEAPRVARHAPPRAAVAPRPADGRAGRRAARAAHRRAAAVPVRVGQAGRHQEQGRGGQSQGGGGAALAAAANGQPGQGAVAAHEQGWLPRARG